MKEWMRRASMEFKLEPIKFQQIILAASPCIA